MMTLECPFCGARDETEFRCGGEGHIQRPGPFDEVSATAWSNYLFYRDNRAGRSVERWCHSYGCGLWFNVLRDTTTHEVLSVYAMGQSAPEPA